ncbi:hypothetical protein [Streptomyces sp. G-G2]|uniref:hypothetical protein n=1 Tax=Streptomyces sp. G-G2 TaxID=3046201 RepID=UPI0024BA3B7C|nr:hypothetical protein [Streptomyces sp. G-G2]MDJ0382351.1 hypothetical protein [Streptomyces sp. G-G2]
MSGTQDKNQQPSKGREEQERQHERQRPGQDEPKEMPGRPSRESREEPTRRREGELDDDMRDDAL